MSDNNEKSELIRLAKKKDFENCLKLWNSLPQNQKNNDQFLKTVNDESDGSNLIHWLSMYNNSIPLLKLILEQTNINTSLVKTTKSNNVGQTPLHWAAAKGNIMAFDILIGNFLLFYYFIFYDFIILRFYFLKEKGHAEMSCIDDSGLTVAHIASQCGQVLILHYISNFVDFVYSFIHVLFSFMCFFFFF